MRVKYQGPHPFVRVRHITFEAGKIVTLDDSNAADMALAAKVLAWDDMTEVKAGRRPKNDKDSNGSGNRSTPANKRRVVKGDGSGG